ncbi:hypothetical protein AAZX31_10G091900 [Glycine max]
MLCPLVPLILSLSKSMVELEPGKVLHDRQERFFGPLVVIVVTPSPFPLQNNKKVYLLHPRFKALLIEGMETTTFRMREAWTNGVKKKRHLFCPIQSQLIPPTPSLPKALVCGYLLHSLPSSVIPLIDYP